MGNEILLFALKYVPCERKTNKSKKWENEFVYIVYVYKIFVQCITRIHTHRWAHDEKTAPLDTYMHRAYYGQWKENCNGTARNSNFSLVFFVRVVSGTHGEFGPKYIYIYTPDDRLPIQLK